MKQPLATGDQTGRSDEKFKRCYMSFLRQ